MTNQTHTWKALTPSRASKMRIARAIQFIAAILLLLPFSVKAQTVAPISGLGNVQFFDNNGALLTSGVLYSYQAGTSTQQATFTDSSGTTQNPNPIPFGSGARVQIWLSIGSFYKFVLCSQNDGPACAAGDNLFTVDQVPGGSTSSSGSSSSPFISGSASPATSGILRLASGDTTCWRNAAGSTNLCISKDANDILTWPGSLKMSEISAPSGVAGSDVLWADNSFHRWWMKGNGGAGQQVVGSGVDINTSDQVTQLHFGAAAAPLGTLPSTNQCFQWNGSSVNGFPCGWPINSVDITGQKTNCGTQTFTTPSANGFYRIAEYLTLTTAAATSSVTPIMTVNFADGNTSGAETIVSGASAGNVVGNLVVFTTAFFAKSGTAITLSCSGYTSNPANAMQYAIHARLEGPF